MIKAERLRLSCAENGGFGFQKSSEFTAILQSFESTIFDSFWRCKNSMSLNSQQQNSWIGSVQNNGYPYCFLRVFVGSPWPWNLESPVVTLLPILLWQGIGKDIVRWPPGSHLNAQRFPTIHQLISPFSGFQCQLTIHLERLSFPIMIGYSW